MQFLHLPGSDQSRQIRVGDRTQNMACGRYFTFDVVRRRKQAHKRKAWRQGSCELFERAEAFAAEPARNLKRCVIAMAPYRGSLTNLGFCNGNETRGSRDRKKTRNSWRPTAFASISGDVEIAPDDWTLLNPSGEPLARVYKVIGGPQDGQWYWSVLFSQTAA